jgi:hypothetical protein
MVTYRCQIAPGIVVQDLGHELVICDEARAVVHRVDGPAATALRLVLGAEGAPVEVVVDDATTALIDAGVLIDLDAATTEQVSRRRMIALGAAAAGAIGLVTMALPGAAAAASGDGPEPGPADPVVGPTRTGVEYPDFTATNPETTVGVRWTQVDAGLGGGSFTFQVTISGPNIATFVVSGLASGSAYTSIPVPGWQINETITISFFTTSLQNNIPGTARTVERLE